MGKTIELSRPDGKTCSGYLALPAAGDAAPGLVVLQEWWGLNDQIKSVADRYAEAGYRALVPDLYHGKLATTAEEAQKLMGALDWGQAVAQDVRGALQHLAATHPKVGVTGYCMGGALTILACLNAPEPVAAVCFYGIPPAAAADASKIKVPFLGHFAVHDDWCNPTAVGALEKSLQAGGVPHTIHRYDAKHAFMNERRPDVYDAACAKTAWERTLAFWKQHLG